nr:protein FATTY ACID EXPORT 5 [Aegilops tauschii subsp. strangulata]
MDDFYVTIPYGLVVLGGGVAGYVKRGSVASLAAAAGFGGAPLLAGALSIWAFTGGHSSSLFATVLHTGYLQSHCIDPYVVPTHSDGGRGAFGYWVYPMGDGSTGYFQPVWMAVM